MEQYLRCNNQANGRICRGLLKHEVIVTTCGHVFCAQCAEETGLIRTPKEQRRCPTCKTELLNDYDVVQNLADPPDSYKASVLAGLDPATIIACAQKALSFWTYQNAQEHGYQQYLAKHLTQKCQQLKTDNGKIVTEANIRIEALETQIQDFTNDRQSMDQQYADLLRQYQEKHKKQQQTQKLYDAIKQKIQVEKMGPAAVNDVDHTLQSIHTMEPPRRMHQELDSRQHVRPADPNHMVNGNGTVPLYRSVQVVPETLHPHQRSGSSAAGSANAHLRMPPPERARLPRLSHSMASNTPLQRAALPVDARGTINRAQIPVTASRGHLQNPLPGSSRRPQVQPTKLPAPAHNYSAMNPHMKIGRAGTSGSFDMGPNYSQYTDRIINPARRSLDQAGAGVPYSAGYM